MRNVFTVNKVLIRSARRPAEFEIHQAMTDGLERSSRSIPKEQELPTITAALHSNQSELPTARHVSHVNNFALQDALTLPEAAGAVAPFPVARNHITPVIYTS